jgi:hypothetical protein
VALCAAAFEQGILPVGTSLADNNPAFIEAIVAYRAGAYDRMEADSKRGAGPGVDEAEVSEDVELEIARIQADGRTVARPTGRRRKRPRRGS